MRWRDDLVNAVGTEFLRKAADREEWKAVMALHIQLLFGETRLSHAEARVVSRPNKMLLFLNKLLLLRWTTVLVDWHNRGSTRRQGRLVMRWKMT